MPEINEFAPNEPIIKEQLKIPSNLQLADPNFNETGEIDILLVAEIF